MIVKNESLAIRRCLESVRGIIDTWVIADTGSTDDTAQIIQETFHDLPGELHKIPWVDFATCRNQALGLAFSKADYILFIDADEELLILDGFEKHSLDKDAYLIRSKGIYSDHFRILLIKDDSNWRWEGSLHEHLVHTQAIGEILPTLINFCKKTDGARSQANNKYLQDASLLSKRLSSDPNDLRALFYLAQSYGNGKEFSLALQTYQKRASLGGSRDEVYWSLYCIGHMQEHLDCPPSEIIHSFCKAFRYDPKRAEPLERLATLFLERNCPLLSYLIATYSLSLTMPTALQSYVHSWVYEYARLYLVAESADLLGLKQQANRLFKELLKQPNLPAEVLSVAKSKSTDFFLQK